MQINADLTQRACVDSESIAWVNSPLPGVQRRMLERDGAEVARATSIVRYAAGSFFDFHTHDAGEEFLVLEGVFSDEMGDFPAGMYVRNPVGSRHKPHSENGTTILVKLRQFDPADQTFVRIDTHTSAWLPEPASGIEIMPLHHFGNERVRLERWPAGTVLPEHQHPGGEEIFVLQGSFSDAEGRYPQGYWLRSPDGSSHAPASAEGCVLFVKTGHLTGTADHDNQ